MENKIQKISLWIILGLLPLLSGCGGGGSSSSSLNLGSLFSSSGGTVGGGDGINSSTVSSVTSGGGTTESGLTDGIVSGGNDPILLAGATANPEPATVFLIGGGIAAMAMYRKKFKKL